MSLRSRFAVFITGCSIASAMKQLGGRKLELIHFRQPANYGIEPELTIMGVCQQKQVATYRDRRKDRRLAAHSAACARS
jgi:hypothetical protein